MNKQLADINNSNYIFYINFFKNKNIWVKKSYSIFGLFFITITFVFLYFGSPETQK